jgi:hypothetical protein
MKREAEKLNTAHLRDVDRDLLSLLKAKIKAAGFDSPCC